MFYQFLSPSLLPSPSYSSLKTCDRLDRVLSGAEAANWLPRSALHVLRLPFHRYRLAELC